MRGPGDLPAPRLSKRSPPSGPYSWGTSRLPMKSIVLFLLSAGLASAAPITAQSLLGDMTNLDQLAEFPQPAYTSKQFSSYDRASKSPSQDWFANRDCGMYLRVEETNGRKEWVMMDADGPGAIVRIWSANPEGVLRIYLDNAAQPVLQAPLQDVLGGKLPAFPPPLACETSRGWNLYFPIPYAKHCKVTCDAGNFYYHVNYRTYPAGTEVETFRLADWEADAARASVAAIASMLENPGQEEAPPAGTERKEIKTTVAPGKTAVLADLRGQRAIRLVRLDWKPGDDPEEPDLRSMVLEMDFDGQTTVQAPLGDFFGASPGLHPFATLPLTVKADGTMECRWVMPFREKAQVRVRNLGGREVSLTGLIVSSARPWTERSLHFHAGWRIQHDLPTEPKIDWNYLQAKGRGVFVGVAFAIDNPVKEWWGEGDEKIYVDGETFPSHFGTGTEDYYGYAWCCPERFTQAYHSQPRCDGPGNFGRTSVNRFHILDRIPFEKDFRFDMEIWHWAKCKVNASVLAMWYGKPGATSAFPPITADDVRLRPKPVRNVPRVAGALEGESLRIVAKTGIAEPQDWAGTSGEQQLWWHKGHQPGDKLVLAFPAPADGRFHVRARFLRAPDYGMARLSVNDQPVGEPVDFYEPKVKVCQEADLGVFDLRKGDNLLAIEITGANPKARKDYMIGLDYLRLEKAE